MSTKRRKPITCCPHCGSTEGIVTMTSYIRVPYFIGFDGVEQENSEMYDNAERIDGGGTAYCQSCGKAVCRTSTLVKQWEDAEKGARR